MVDSCRRYTLQTLTGLITFSLAGCSTGTDSTKQTTSTPSPVTVSEATPTPTDSPTATKTPTPGNSPLNVSLPQEFQVEVIPRVTEKNRDNTHTIQAQLEDQNGLKLEDIDAYLENKAGKQEAAAQVTQKKREDRNTAKVQVRLDTEHVQPGATNQIGFKATDGRKNQETAAQDFNVEPAPWKIHLEDSTGALKLQDPRYTTNRGWDDITNTLTTAEFLTDKGPKEQGSHDYTKASIYWNDVAHGADIIGGYRQLEKQVDQRVAELGPAPSTAEKIEALVRGTHEGILQESNITGSGGAYQPFFGHERKYAWENWSWDTDKFFASTIRGNKGNHEIIYIAYEDDQGEWQLRYHEPFNDDGIQEWENSFYGKPGEMVYSDQSANSAVDGFNHSKLLEKATDGNITTENTVSDIHYMPVSSLLRMADATENDVEPKTRRTVFEKDYLEQLEKTRLNQNFDRETLETLIEAGRKLFTVYNSLDEDDFIGIGGEPGDEEFYRLGQQQYERALETYRRDDLEFMNDLDSFVAGSVAA